MSRESKPKQDNSKIGEDLLITCSSGRQFIIRNIGERTKSLVEGYALSGESIPIEISNIERVCLVDLEISETGSIYPPMIQPEMHDPHASETVLEKE